METNPVRRAMKIVGGPEGRPEHLAVVCGVSAASVYNWITLGYVRDSRYAVLISEATLSKGHPMTVRELAGLGVATTGEPPAQRRRDARKTTGRQTFSSPSR